MGNITVVDAYNNEKTLHFYESNSFKYLHASEEEECRYYNIENKEISTRLMYFDLMQ